MNDLNSKTIDISFAPDEITKIENIKIDMAKQNQSYFKFNIIFIIWDFNETKYLFFEIVNGLERPCLIEFIKADYLMEYHFIVDSHSPDDSFFQDPDLEYESFIDSIEKSLDIGNYDFAGNDSAKWEFNYKFKLDFRVVGIIRNRQNVLIKTITNQFAYRIYFRTKTIHKEQITFESIKLS